MICGGKKQSTTKEFIKKAIAVHGNKYDYNLVNYKNSNLKIKIICSKHGIFEQTPQKHLFGRGCMICGGSKKSTTEEFIKKAIKIYNNKYDYSLVRYKTSKSKIEIICKKHGIFEQTPQKHLFNQGCPICNNKGESKIFNYLTKNNILFTSQHKFENCKHINRLPFDFYLPKYNLCIEYDGVQHFKPVKCFGGKKEFKLTQK